MDDTQIVVHGSDSRRAGDEDGDGADAAVSAATPADAAVAEAAPEAGGAPGATDSDDGAHLRLADKAAALSFALSEDDGKAAEAGVTAPSAAADAAAAANHQAVAPARWVP
eukprot:Rhum_TRINITY_DN14748_c6_g1::Rhum_TRINITY_DN14748_c6_g1_i1::g.114630::m.114630